MHIASVIHDALMLHSKRPQLMATNHKQCPFECCLLVGTVAMDATVVSAKGQRNQ